MRSVLRLSSSIFVCALALLQVTPASGAEVPAEPPEPLRGHLSILWGDARPGGEPATPRKVVLTDDHGVTTPLAVSDDLLRGGVFRWNGRRVTAFPVTTGERRTKSGELRVAALRLDEAGAEKSTTRAAVTGSQPWISLLCKFSDIADEPRDLDYFQEMYADSPGRLDHYWREVSADHVDIVGSMAIDWVVLPGTQTDYVPTPGAGATADLGAIFDDCTAAVDSFVDFSCGGAPYAGINLMINAALDCCAWGGGRWAELDGVEKVWRTTWNPPWAFQNVAIIAHEMGHGFGLPHANNSDDDGNPYDSPWDVMSAATGYATTDPTYGALGKHVNAYHKDSLGWFASARRFEAPDESETSILLDHTALAQSSNYQLVRIPIDAERWYTVEARQRSGDYELRLPGDAVIVHSVDPGRAEPSWVVDADIPPATFSDNPGTTWTVGETFHAPDRDLSVTVDEATTTGFAVTIRVGPPIAIFEDGFESGDASRWSPSDP